VNKTYLALFVAATATTCFVVFWGVAVLWIFNQP
jgi:hypothetical protein